MEFLQRMIATIGVVMGGLVLAVVTSPGQESPGPQRVEIPATATVLKGIPTAIAHFHAGSARSNGARDD